MLNPIGIAAAAATHPSHSCLNTPMDREEQSGPEAELGEPAEADLEGPADISMLSAIYVRQR